MAGLEKILEHIEADAATAKETVLSEAKAKEEGILQVARQEEGRIEREARERAAREEKDIVARAEASAEMKSRQKLLAKKQAIITETLSEAKERVLHLPDEAYFAVILQLICRMAKPGEGVLYFSEKDKKRLPAHFAETLEGAIQETGAKLSIADKSRNMEGGVVLSYGGVEENASIEAVFSSHKEELTDLLSKKLFG